MSWFELNKFNNMHGPKVKKVWNIWAANKGHAK
jgi:hypothetical protein